MSRARRRMYAWNGLWYLLAANLVGRQWAEWSIESGLLQDLNVKPREPYLTFNFIWPTVLRECAMLSLERPPWAGIPSNTDEASISSARMDAKLLEHYWISRNMDEREQMDNVSRITFGYVAYEADFDITQGRMTKRAWSGGRHEFEGAVITRTWLPFEVLTDADATEPDRLRWVATERMEDIGWLRLAYDRGHEVQPEKPSPTDYLHLRLQNLSSHQYAVTTRQDDSERFPHHARWKRIWYYPYDEWPEGREIHMAGSVVLYDGKWRHDHLTQGEMRKHPLIFDYYMKPPGRMQGMGLVEPALEPQWEYNKTRSQYVKIKNKCAKPKWLAPTGNQLENAPDDEPNELITYNIDPLNPGGKPEPITPQIAVGAFSEHWNSTLIEFDRITSQADASRGVNPPGVRSGVAIERLQFADQLSKGMPMKHHVAAIKKLGAAIVGLYREYGNDEVVLSIVGNDYQYEFHSWRKKNSRHDTRIEILHDSGVPLLPSERLTLMTNLIKLGAVDPLTQRNDIYRYLRFPGLERAFVEEDIDYMQAKRENEEMLAGSLPVPTHEDNHDAHIEEHTNFIKTYREMSPTTKAMARMHISWHLSMKAKLQQQNAELMADLGGAQDMGELGMGYGTDAPAPGDEPEEPTPPGASAAPGGKKGGGSGAADKAAPAKPSNAVVKPGAGR